MELNFAGSLTLSPKLNEYQIQFLSFLKMQEMELQEYVENVMLENPMIDVSSTRSTSDIDFHTWYRSSGHAISYSVGSHSSYDSDAYLNLVRPEAPPTLHRLIWEQLDLSHCSKADAVTITYLVESLDDKGFLPYTPEELSHMSGIDIDYIRYWITSLKALEPIGLFSYDVADCLKSQLVHKGCSSSIAYTIVQNYFDLFVAGKTNLLAKELHVSTAVVKEACRILAELDPYPNVAASPQTTSYIIPDIILKDVGGKWDVCLNDGWYENYSLCDYYYQLMQTTTDTELAQYLESKYRQAHSIIENIAKRRKTLISLTEKIAVRQASYLRRLGSLLPMTMSELAEEMGLSTSTISRAVSGKYIQTPVGIILMKDLFRSGYQNTRRDTSISSDHIIAQIKKLIQSEDSSMPYSDQWLADYISSCNDIHISRRTVTKYRESTGIPSTRKRRLLKK